MDERIENLLKQARGGSPKTAQQAAQGALDMLYGAMSAEALRGVARTTPSGGLDVF